ncbi:MAG: hypothetical protein KA144_04625 [Xanthomonadaceae bacterium]|nr:hypothetical protein [Xanthomonadaceae bacterium]
MKVKRILTGLLLLCGLLSLGSATARFPPFGYVYDIEYFSDYTYTTRVGSERYTCTTYYPLIGERTTYKVEHLWPCEEN